MPIRPPRLLPARALIATGCLLVAAGSCHAATSVYFDLGGLAYVASYLLGFLVFPIVMFNSDRKAFWGRILAAYIAAPFAFLLVAVAMKKTLDHYNREKVKRADIKSVAAFTDYCKDRKRLVTQRVPPGPDTSLFFRYEPNYTGGSEVTAYGIHDYTVKTTAICQQTGLRYVEDFGRKYAPDRKSFEPEVRTFRVCHFEEWRTSTQSQARYELVFGESSERKRVPWGDESGRSEMSKSSVRVMDKQTGATLAKDTMYFLSNKTGEGGCPEAMEQITSLIADVFPKK